MTFFLIALNLIAFLLETANEPAVVALFALWPPAAASVAGAPPFHWWQLATYSFLHANGSHLFFNMFGLFMFGKALEYELGRARLATLYFASVVAGALVQIAVLYGSTPTGYPTVGASAGVFGLLLGYAMRFPRRRVVLLFPPIPMPAWLFATLYAALELLLGVTGTAAGVAHFAHLGGMLGALLCLLWWARAAPPRHFD